MILDVLTVVGVRLHFVIVAMGDEGTHDRDGQMHHSRHTSTPREGVYGDGHASERIAPRTGRSVQERA